MDRILNKQKFSNLFIFNLETNLDSPALAFTHEWIAEFSNHYKKVFVYSFKVGRTGLPRNVSVHELGSGNSLQRIKNILYHFIIVFKILLKRSEAQVFYHMNVRSAMLIGLPLKLFRINQVLWYSHSAKPRSLRFATKFVDTIVSTSRKTFPISTRKLICTGHGIVFPDISESISRQRQIIVVLGRVSRSKRIHHLIPEIAKFNSFQTSKTLALDVLGQTMTNDDLRYQNELIKIAHTYNVNVNFKGSIPKAEIFDRLSTYFVSYNGMEGTIDKAAIEATYAGCYLVSDQVETLKQCGFISRDEITEGILPSISTQLKNVYEINEHDLFVIRQSVKVYVRNHHSLNKTIEKIVSLLQSQDISN